MSKRKPNAQTHFDSDPARPNVRDPEQKNDELERRDHPRQPDPAGARRDAARQGRVEIANHGRPRVQAWRPPRRSGRIAARQTHQIING